MKVLVTGGAGYIGSHTVSGLLKSGYEVVVLDNLSSGFREAVDPKAYFYQGNVNDKTLLKEIFKSHKMDAVIHFAAKLIVEESVAKPQEYYFNNLVSSLLLFKECVANGVNNIIFSSTAAVYGESLDGNLLNESSACKPINPYGKTKLFVERMLQDLEQAGLLRYVILRYFNVAGAEVNGGNGQRTKGATHLIKIASEAAAGKRKEVMVFGTNYPTPDGTCVRDYIHVQDLASAHLKALKYLIDGGKSDTFNCGYSKGYSVLEVLDHMKKVSHSDFEVKYSARRKGDAPSVVSDAQKIKSVLGWKPEYDKIDLICETAYEWEKSRP